MLHIKRSTWHITLFQIGIALLLGSIGIQYHEMLVHAQEIHSLALSPTTCEAFQQVLQPTTIAALAGAIVAVLGGVSSIIKSFQTRVDQSPPTAPTTPVSISSLQPPPHIK